MTVGPAESSRVPTQAHDSTHRDWSQATEQCWVYTSPDKPRVEYLTPPLLTFHLGSLQFLGNYQIFELHATQLAVPSQPAHLTLLDSWLCWHTLHTAHKPPSWSPPHFLSTHSYQVHGLRLHVNNTKHENYPPLLISSTLRSKSVNKKAQTMVSGRFLSRVFELVCPVFSVWPGFTCRTANIAESSSVHGPGAGGPPTSLPLRDTPIPAPPP